jgi:ParB family chromosome partitioning protein
MSETAQAQPGPAVTGVPAVLPLAALASHPRNPREGLGDLAEITASIAQHGVYEPLVVVTAAAYTAAADHDGDTARPEGGSWTHVIVMGHRRAAAARAAGLQQVPAVVRDDLAGAPALAAMIAENMHRAGLEPLAEAGAMGELARLGWSQRAIAAEVGCSQAHVSKRLTLLDLPATARAAVAAGKMAPAQAVGLHKAIADVDPDVAEQVITVAVDDIGSGYRADGAVAAAGRNAVRFQAAKKTRADLGARGIEVIEQGKRYRMNWPQVSARDVRAHEKAGCLAAAIDYDGRPDYACVNPASHGRPSGETPEQAEEKQLRKAAKARDAACTAIAAGPLPPAGELARILAATLLEGVSHAETLRVACKWLRDAGMVPDGAGHYALHKQLTAAGDHAGLARYAYACTLAAAELHARSRHAAWGGRHAAHLARLTAEAGYQPTAWELARLEEVRQAAEARESLACADCGCTAAQDPADDCTVAFDRKAAKPVYKCHWECRRHKAPRTAAAPAPGDGEGPADPAGEELHDLMRDLIAAVDHTTAAGSRLPDDVDAAIDGARTAFYACLSRHPSDHGSVTAAVRGLAAAAAPHEAAWTPELRDALAALVGAGVTPQEPAGDAETGPADADGADDLGDLIRGLIIAVHPTTAAGSRLPGDVDAAIGGARECLSAAWRDRTGEESDGVLPAVRGLAAAATPHEAAWTPELRDALAALAGAGVTGPRSTAGDAVT